MSGNFLYQKFEKQLDEVDKLTSKPKLLLHACCCPCSSHCIELLEKHFDITVFFYNPNIDEKAEYEKRLEELIRFSGEAEFARNIKIVRGEYEPELFHEMARGMENLPERGERCYKCYELRLGRTARYAAEQRFDFFTTTLSISPYKNAEWINEIGMRLETDMREKNEDSESKIPVFLFSDFKKKNGYKRSIELSAEYNLYRQDYCGCVYSKIEKERKAKEKQYNDVNVNS
ncbi:MAG: epoxyqueuosine reductase QueH [Eubacterium sp.]|nr:epoxyqueuosine reductase QueH [Eubacterium sp.]